MNLETLRNYNITELIPLMSIINLDKSSINKYYTSLMVIPKSKGLLSARNQITIDNYSAQSLKKTKLKNSEYFGIFQITFCLSVQEESDGQFLFKYIKIQDIRDSRKINNLENELFQLASITNSVGQAKSDFFLRNYEQNNYDETFYESKNQITIQSPLTINTKLCAYLNRKSNYSKQNKNIKFAQEQLEASYDQVAYQDDSKNDEIMKYDEKYSPLQIYRNQNSQDGAEISYSAISLRLEESQRKDSNNPYYQQEKQSEYYKKTSLQVKQEQEQIINQQKEIQTYKQQTNPSLTNIKSLNNIMLSPVGIQSDISLQPHKNQSDLNYQLFKNSNELYIQTLKNQNESTFQNVKNNLNDFSVQPIINQSDSTTLHHLKMQSESTFQIKNQSYSTIQAAKIQNQEQKQAQKVQKEKLKLDFSMEKSNNSVSRSTESRTSNERNQMMKKIRAKVGIKNLAFFTLIGLLSLCLFLTLTITGYSINQKGISQFSPCFKIITRPIEMLFNTMDVARQTCFNTLISNDFPDEDKAFIKKQSDAAKEKATNVFQDFQEDFMKLVLQYSDDSMIDFMKSQIMDVKVMTQLDIEASKENTKFSQRSKTLLDLLKDYYVVSAQLVNTNAKDNQYFMWENLPSLRSVTSNFQDYIVSRIDDILGSNLLNYWIQLIATLFMSVLLNILFLIFKYFSIINKQNMLCLMGSIKPDLLELQCTKINAIVEYLSKSVLKKSNAGNARSIQNLGTQIFSNDQLDENDEIKNFFDIQNSSQKRKRSIAQFDTLPKIKLAHIFVSLVIMLAFILQSSLNIILVKPFIREQEWLQQSKIAILELAASIQQVTTPQLFQLKTIFDNQNPLTTIQYQFLKNETATYQSKKSFSTYLSFPPQFNRHNQLLYDELYDKVVNNNICDVMLTHPQFFVSNYTQQECTSLAQGILTKGVLQSINHAFKQVQLFSEIYEQFTYQSTNDFKTVQKQIQLEQKQTKAVSDLNDLVKAIEHGVIALNLYYYKVAGDYTEQITSTIYFLFWYQIVFVIFAMFIGWNKLFSQINQELIQTKSSLTLFHLDILLESIVIKKYFSKNKFGIH